MGLRGHFRREEGGGSPSDAPAGPDAPSSALLLAGLERFLDSEAGCGHPHRVTVALRERAHDDEDADDAPRRQSTATVGSLTGYPVRTSADGAMAVVRIDGMVVDGLRVADLRRWPPSVAITGLDGSVDASPLAVWAERLDPPGRAIVGAWADELLQSLGIPWDRFGSPGD